MKTSFTMLKTLVAVVALIGCATFAQAQNRERFGISAKAGGINAVTGRVGVRRDGKPPRLLTSQDDLEDGDVVTTGVSGQVEVLLSPGTYLRLAERSEFVMEDTSLDNLLVRLTKGSAIIEATGPSDLKLYIPIVTDQHRMTIVRPGVYRFNVAAGTTELFVRKGRMALSDNKDDVVKSGKKVTFASSGQQIAKLTDSDADQFDEWSKLRGQTLARANLRLSMRTVNSYLSANSFGNSFSSGWGLWTWSPFSSCYTFLPFHNGWGSPYGGSYGWYVSGFNNGYYGNRNNPYYPPVITSNSSGGSSSGYPGGGSSGSGSTGVGGSSGGYGGGGSSGGYGGGSSGGRSIGTPTVTAPSTAGPRDPDSGGRGQNGIKPIN
jgi:ferric-dicitrate binding protein FerR (iron transport regulator)